MSSPGDRTLVLNLQATDADTRLKRNIISVTSAIAQSQGTIDEKGLVLKAGNSITLATMTETKAVVMYSTQPITLKTQVVGNATVTTFLGQTLFVTTGGVADIELENEGTKDAVVSVIRIAESVGTMNYRIARHLVTFSALSRITAIGSAVLDLTKVEVQDVTLATFTNDQVTAPGIGPNVVEKFRICDADGTPNATGAYIMYLDDIVTQQNFSGTLQLWVAERA